MTPPTTSAPVAATVLERSWFWSLAVVAVVAVCSSTALAVRARSRRREHEPPIPSDWATVEEVERLACEFPAPRWPLGESARGIRLGAPAHASLSVVAAAGDGATDSLVVPAVLQFDGSLVIVASAPDVMLLTSGHRSRLGPVYVFDPAQSTTHGSVSWSPLRASRGSYAAARSTARVFVDTLAGDLALSECGALFRSEHSVDVLAAALRAADLTGAGLVLVREWLRDASSNRIGRVLEATGDWRALHDWNAVRALPDAARRETFALGLAAFAAFTDPGVSGRLDIRDHGDDVGVLDPAELLDSGGPWTLYVISTSATACRARPVLDVLIGSIVRAGHERFLESGLPLDPQVGLIVDGTGVVAAPANLGTIASHSAGAGMPLMSIWPDPHPSFAGYGREQARSIRSSHTCQIVVGGTYDDRASERFEELFGGPVLDHLPGTGAAVVLSSLLAPATVRLRRWSHDTDLVASASRRDSGPSPPVDGASGDPGTRG